MIQKKNTAKNTRSLRFTSSAVIAILVLVVLLVFNFGQAFYRYNTAEQLLHEDLISSAERIAVTVGPYIWNYDIDNLRESLIMEIESARAVSALKVLETDGTILVEVGEVTSVEGPDGDQIIRQNISSQDTDLGTLVLVYSLDDLDATFLSDIIIGFIQALFVSLLIVIVVIMFLNRKIIQPIQMVAKSIHALGEGDISQHLQLRGKDELSIIASDYNTAAQRLRSLLEAVKEQTAVLTEIGSNLTTEMKETEAAVTNIRSNTQNLSSRAEGQSKHADSTHEIAQRIASDVTRLNNQIEQQTVAVSQSSASIEQMLSSIQSVSQTLTKNNASVQKLSSAAEQGREDLESVTSDIKTVAHNSENLLEISTVIQNIASQTNLLSMNASIEAAHAGDAGKGFSVVAEEVRKLAETSSEESQKVASVLNNIKESVDKIDQSVEQVLAQFESIEMDVKSIAQQESSIKDAMEEQTTGSKEVFDALMQLKDITQTVQEHSQEIADGTSQVSQDSELLSTGSNEMNNGINEISAASGQIQEAITRVADMSEETINRIDRLSHNLMAFKTER
ncbi:MAG: methyl-accepting chemotaxis protein [Spirochaetia bacterium]